MSGRCQCTVLLSLSNRLGVALFEVRELGNVKVVDIC